MLQGIYYKEAPEGPNFELKYPHRAKQPMEVLTVKDFEQARCIWNIRTRKYIFETLRGWAMQRMHALKAGENHFRNTLQTKNSTVEKFLLLLLTHYESSLQTLTFKIAQNRKDIEFIAPPISSKFYSHFDEVILPIVEWCEEAQTQFKKQQVNN